MVGFPAVTDFDDPPWHCVHTEAGRTEWGQLCGAAAALKAFGHHYFMRQLGAPGRKPQVLGERTSWEIKAFVIEESKHSQAS